MTATELLIKVGWRNWHIWRKRDKVSKDQGMGGSLEDPPRK